MADDFNDGSLGALGALSRLAQDPIDPSRKWLGYAAGALAPTKSGSFGESMSNALGMMDKAQSEQEALRASYIPHVTQALIQAAQFQQQRDLIRSAQEQMAKEASGYAPPQGGMPPSDGGMGGTAQNGPTYQGPQIPTGARPAGGLLRPNQPLGPSMLAFGMDPKGYMDQWRKQFEPTDLEKKDTYLGVSPQQSRATDLAERLAKSNGLTVGSDGISRAAPGYSNSIAGIEGAKTAAQEGAKASFDVMDPTKFTHTGTGDPFAGTRADYIRQTNGAPSNPNVSGLDLSKLTPQQIALLKQKDPSAFANGVADFAQTSGQGGDQGGLKLQSEADKKRQLGQIDLTQGAQGELNKNWIKESLNPVVQAGRDAQAMHANLDALQNIDMKTGWGTEAKAAAANMLTGLGIAPKNAESFAGNAQKFQSVAMERLWQVLNTAKGPQTEGDADRAKATFAKLTNTNEANQFIVDLNRARANSDIRRSSYYNEMMPHAQQEGDLPRVDREWMKIQKSIWDDPIMQKWKAK